MILRRISRPKFDATRCQILMLKCTKFDFRWGQTPLGSSPGPLAVFKGPTFKGKRKMRGRREREGERRMKNSILKGEGPARNILADRNALVSVRCKRITH